VLNRTCLIRRSRRRSGGGLVRVGSEVGTLEKKRAVEDVTGETLDMMVMMSALDNGPHREMAVDVPDSFIARNKTPPRYPPPSRANRTPGTQQVPTHLFILQAIKDFCRVHLQISPTFPIISFFNNFRRPHRLSPLC